MDSDEARSDLEEAARQLVEAPEERRDNHAATLKTLATNDLLASSYARLQFIIGALAFLLPVVVPLFDWIIDGHELRGSISSYYYGRTGGYFVGSLAAIGVFLFSYNYRRRPGFAGDDVLSSAAGTAAIAVALFPTPSNGADATGGAAVVGAIHLASAATLFSILAVLALCYFTRTDPEPHGFRAALVRTVRDDSSTSAKRRADNLLYRICGWTIVAGVLLAIANNIFDWGLLFWLEAVMVWAFGISWLRKSRNLSRAARGLMTVFSRS